jgi:hypothetical protein
MEMWMLRTDCALGCLSDGMPRCRPFFPSTVDSSELDGTVDLDLVGTGPMTGIRTFAIDTSTC